MIQAIHIQSLGAGVQSSTAALMAVCGELTPMPTAAIFSDTQSEPASVYKWLDWLETQLPFPVYRVTAGSLENEAVRMRMSKKGKLYSRTDIPFFTKAEDGSIGKITNRSCTADYKIKPIMKEAKRIGGKAEFKQWQKEHAEDLAQLRDYVKELREWNKKGIEHGQPKYPQDAWGSCQENPFVIQWIGISTDEQQRMKPSRYAWAKSIWPLVTKRMSRLNCLDWMRERGYPEPPRSSCVFCPFHNNREWRRLQLEEPAEFQRAVLFESTVQKAKSASEHMQDIPYLHRSCKPLNEIDFRDDFERGQLSLWNDECEGMCGV